MPDEKDSMGLEKKRDAARSRAKRLRENIEAARRHQEGTSQTPGVKVVGYEFLDSPSSDRASAESIQDLVTSYILRRGGFEVRGEDAKVMSILTIDLSTDVSSIFIARITGPDEKWGLARKFYTRRDDSIKASQLEDGSVIEYGVESYKGFVSRTYYVVKGWEFHPFVQHNFRKGDASH